MRKSKPKYRLAENFPLLAKGGGAGEIIISKDWSKNPLGSIDKWPPELITSLGIILYCPVPMFLIWGDHSIFFYNDAYRNSANYGEGKTEKLGLPAKEALSEIWKFIKPEVERVLSSKVILLNDPLSDLNDKNREKLSGAFSFSPVANEGKEIKGLLGTCINTFLSYNNGYSEKNNSLGAEERLNMAIEASGISIWEIDLQNNTFEYSYKLAEIFGHNKSKKLSLQEVRNQVYPEDMQMVTDAFDLAVEKGKYEYEVRIIKPDNSIIHIRTKGKMLFDENGKPVKLIGTLRDISKEQQIRQDLEKSERRLRRLILNAPIAIGILSGPDYLVEIINERALSLMGKTKEQMLNKPVLNIITELNLELAKSLLDSVYYSGKPYIASEFPVKLNRFGRVEKVYINFEYHPLINSQEKIYGIMVIGIDVTDQVIARKKIEESEAGFKLLADSMPQFVWSADSEGNIDYFNMAVYDFSGLTKQQVQTGMWLEIVHPDERSHTIKLWKKAINTGKDFTIEHRFRRFDGQYRWQLSRAVSLCDETGKIQQWIGTSTDIQNMKLQEQHKDFFISMASHELKTPITSMKGYVQILQSMYENNEDKFLKKSLDRIHNQIEKLISIIGDLLDVSKIRSGLLTFHKQDFEINKLIRTVIEELIIIYPLHKIVFAPDNDLKVYADRDRVGQVLTNLIGNAIKYSPKSGNVFITSRVSQKSVMISVKDEGIGIEKNFQRKIFERFYRVEGKSEKTFPGFGIGLFIASEIVRRHRGSIGVESEPGKGSRFYFSLPRAKKL
ncbi:MAG: PAS domain-containing protein [Ginsengibacter sp.]